MAAGDRFAVPCDGDMGWEGTAMRPSIEIRTARRFWVSGGLVAAMALTGCSSPLDVSTAERAASATCEALEPLPGVSTASCAVDDGGFDAGIRRRTAVELADGATAEQARTLVAAWHPYLRRCMTRWGTSRRSTGPCRTTIRTASSPSPWTRIRSGHRCSGSGSRPTWFRRALRVSPSPGHPAGRRSARSSKPQRQAVRTTV